MKGLRAHHLKGLETTAVEDWALPEPSDGQIRIAVAACGVNFADLSALSGERRPSPTTPFTPGVEVAGAVSAIGKGVQGFKVGDQVVAFTPWGGMAEQAIAPAATTVAVPKGLSPQTAAALPVAYAGTLVALIRARLSKDDRLLVFGAGSHIGLAAVALGKCLGAQVIAAASGDEKSALPKEAGADHTIDPTTTPLAEAISTATERQGVNVVFDPVGGNSLTAALPSVTVGARIIIAGFAAGKASPLNTTAIFAKNAEVYAANAMVEIATRPDAMRAALQQVVAWAAEGKLRPRVAARFPLPQARHALDYVLSRRGTGAVLVTMS
jgi:NADPH2:quinone reductase